MKQPVHFLLGRSVERTTPTERKPGHRHRHRQREMLIAYNVNGTIIIISNIVVSNIASDRGDASERFM